MWVEGEVILKRYSSMVKAFQRVPASFLGYVLLSLTSYA